MKRIYLVAIFFIAQICARPITKADPEMQYALNNFINFFINAEPKEFNQPQPWEELFALLEQGANFLSANIDINMQHPETGVTLLYCATKQKMHNLIEALLSQYAEPDTQDTVLLNTPLHAAAENKDEIGIRLLCEHGANPNLGNLEQQTPLHKAVMHNHVPSAQILLSHRADKDLKDRYTKRPIDYAIKREYAELITLLS